LQPASPRKPAKYTIKTIAGIGTSGFTGDGAAATAAQFDTPYSVVRDSSGNLYIADQANNRVRKIDTAGTITTFAGDGTQFFLGDGGQAAKASMIHPLGVAVAPNGEIYIADTRNHVIRKVTSAGVISTVVGTSVPGFSGDQDTDTTTDDPLAINSNIDRPIGMVFDAAGNLYFADSLNQRIRKLTTDGKLATIAGTGEAAFFGDGDLATKAKLNYPQGLAIDKSGNIYIGDGENHVVRKINVADGIISTVAGNHIPGFGGDGGKATDASLFYPRGIAIDASGNLLIADTFNQRIRRVAEDGTITTIAGDGVPSDFGDDSPAESAELLFPTGVATGPNGLIYVVDTQNHKIKLLTPLVATPTVAPTIDADGVTSASAYGGFKQAAPGSWIEIYGANFAGATTEWTANDFVNGKAPVSLGGVTVNIGGQPAPLASVGSSRIEAQVPTGIGVGPQQVSVKTAAGTANFTLNVNSPVPGLLAPRTLSVNKNFYASAVFADGSTLAIPEGVLPGFTTRAAKPGESITLYGIGFGAVTPEIAAGQIPGRQTALTRQLKVYFGGTEAQVTYAGLAPGSVGLYQINLIVPNVASSDAVPISFTLGGQPGAQTNLNIAVGN